MIYCFKFKFIELEVAYFLAYLIVLSLFIVPVLVWRKFYPKPLTSCHVCSDGKFVVTSVKPGRRWFKSICGGSALGSVRVGYRYVAFFADRSDKLILRYDDSFIPSDFYIFSVGFLGRLKSVDVSSRSYSDVIKKIKFIEV